MNKIVSDNTTLEQKVKTLSNQLGSNSVTILSETFNSQAEFTAYLTLQGVFQSDGNGRPMLSTTYLLLCDSMGLMAQMSYDMNGDFNLKDTLDINSKALTSGFVSGEGAVYKNSFQDCLPSQLSGKRAGKVSTFMKDLRVLPQFPIFLGF